MLLKLKFEKMQKLKSKSEKIKEILGLGSSLVGVKFIFSEEEIPNGIEKLNGYRYCQALMKARHGAHVLLDAEGIACPAAAAAFGFKPLPEPLKNGKGLVGFGIVFNMSMGCYGCRDATDICPSETVLGFPFKDFAGIAENIEMLGQKAIPNSRGKNALALIKKKEAEKILESDPFQK